jgi:hypothetical protein
MNAISQTPRPLAVDQAFGPGHNRPPISEVLAADFADLVRAIDADVEAARRDAPTAIATDDDLTKAGAVLKRLLDRMRQVEDERDPQKRPIIEAGREIDGFFRRLSDIVDSEFRVIKERADDYSRAKAAAEAERRRRIEAEAREKEAAARRKAETAKSPESAAKAAAEAERQATRAQVAAAGNAAPVRGAGVTVSSRKSIKHRIVDQAALTASLGPLGPFIGADAVDKAIKAKVRIDRMATTIPGVEVFEDNTIGVR